MRADWHGTWVGLLCIGHIALLPALFALVWWDQRSHRLPDALTLPALLLSQLGVMALAHYCGNAGVLERAGYGLALAVGVFWLLAEAPGAPMGFGDVKLAAVLGLHVGAHDPGAVVAWIGLAFVVGGAHSGWLMGRGILGPRDHLAFGPHMVIAWCVVVATMSGNFWESIT